MKDLTKIKEFLQSVGADLSRLDSEGKYHGSLDLYNCSSLTSVTFPEGMAIGGSLYLEKMKAVGRPIKREYQWPMVWEWKDRKYIKADGIFTRLISNRGNVYKVSRIGSNKETYLVTNGSGKWAHGDTLKETKRGLIYKISNRDTSRYAGLTLDSEMIYEEAIEAYRVITGA